MQPNDQNPEQPKQPQSPLQNQPTNGSSMGRTLQPLSSEDEIRSQVQAARPEPIVRSAPGQVSPTASTVNASTEGQQEPGTLITEPLRRPVQNSPLASHSSQQATPSYKSGGRKIVSILMSLLIIATLGAGIYFFFFNGKLAAVDLVETTAQQTSYLRPKTWQPISAGLGVQTYSDLGEGGKAVSTVTVNENLSIKVVGSSEGVYGELRSQTVQKSSVDLIRAAFRNKSKDCTSDVEFRTEPDTKTNEAVVGLALATGTCTRADGDYTVKMRTVIGKEDGLMRQIMIGASDSDWSKSQAAFQTMLDSVGPVKRNS